MSSLDALFDRYEQRKREETDAADEVRRAAAATRQRFASTLRDVVEPVLRATAEQIQLRGYTARVETTPEGSEEPRVGLGFGVRPDHPPARLVFHRGEGDTVRARIETATAGDPYALPPKGAPTPELPTAEVKAGWVTRVVHLFVEQVLRGA